VTEVHWRIIANLGFKFRFQFIARGKGSSPGSVEGSSRAMLATTRPSCSLYEMDILSAAHGLPLH